ncbi:hypothetical protein D557_4030 [Bordetella holmesii 70147]|nr:hypothetical protein D557_4030 [Bordetella holmesii 70147]
MTDHGKVRRRGQAPGMQQWSQGLPGNALPTAYPDTSGRSA